MNAAIWAAGDQAEIQTKQHSTDAKICAISISISMVVIWQESKTN